MNIKHKSTLEKFKKNIKLKNYANNTIEIYFHISNQLLNKVSLPL